MPATPTISVVMSVYNGEPFLSEAVESILNQTHKDFEFIIVNDGSKDTSLVTLERFSKSDHRIRLISRDNKGLITSLNEGVALALGKYMARMDADDVALPTRFEKQLTYLESHLDTVALGSRVLLIDSDGDSLCEMPDALTHDQIDHAHLNGLGQPFYHPAGMFRLDAIRQIGAYRQYETLEDLDLFLRLAEIGKIENLPEVLLHYRQHVNSVGHAKMAMQRQMWAIVMKDTARRRGIKPPEPRNNSAPETISTAAQEQKWAWWALGAGNVKNARKHALRCVARQPFGKDSWRVLACAIRGH